MRAARHRLAGGLAAIVAVGGGPARALDKQGSAHKGAVEGQDDGLGASGTATMGLSLYNPSYAARPDNTGLALFRYALHLDVDLWGRRLSVPLDANLFSDRRRGGALAAAPTELDVIGGLTTTWRAGPGAVEVGARVEDDRPLDLGTYTQSYADLRVRYLLSTGPRLARIGGTARGGGASAVLTLGWFAWNPTYAARPDNTGLALLRYGLRTEIGLLGGRLAAAVEITSFTDRSGDPVRPTELDLVPEIVWRPSAVELHLAYERDLPLDRGGLVQSFVFLLVAWSFGR